MSRRRPGRYVVGRVEDIPDQTCRIVDLDGRSVGVFNVGGRFYAVLNRCPHRGAELCRGTLVGRLDSPAPGVYRHDSSRTFLQCPWHGWEFDLETGQSYFDPAGVRVRAYDVDVQDGRSVECELQRGQLGQSPLVAEVYAASVESDYVVVTLARRRG
jgi:nitrite reductase/ring-hydroxylating ferredoxin subunit